MSRVRRGRLRRSRPIRVRGTVRSGRADRHRLLPMGLMAAGALAGLPAFAVSAPPSRVRATGRARHAETPVFLERDRRDPRRHGTATAPELPPAASADVAVVADHAPEIDQVAHQYLPDVAA